MSQMFADFNSKSSALICAICGQNLVRNYAMLDNSLSNKALSLFVAAAKNLGALGGLILLVPYRASSWPFSLLPPGVYPPRRVFSVISVAKSEWPKIVVEFSPPIR